MQLNPLRQQIGAGFVAFGKSRGGATTKIRMCADAHGNPIDFEITGKSTMPKLRPDSPRKSKSRKTSLQTRDTIRKRSENMQDKSELIRSFPAEPTVQRLMRSLINTFINRGILLKIFLHESNTFAALPIDLKNSPEIKTHRLSCLFLYLAQDLMRTRPKRCGLFFIFCKQCCIRNPCRPRFEGLCHGVKLSIRP